MSRKLSTFDPRQFALTLTCGVLLVHALSQLPEWSICAALALPALIPWRGRNLWSGFALGALISVMYGQQWLIQRWPESRQGEEYWLAGTISSLPTTDGIAQHFIFEPDPAIQLDPAAANLPSLPARIRAGWYHSDVHPRAGECWHLHLRLRAPRGSSNPGGFDYEGWLYRQNITANATVRDGQPCTTTLNSSGHTWASTLKWPSQKLFAPGLYALRQNIRDHFQQWLPDAPARGLVEALTVGDTSELHDADWALFRLSGTSHLVAVSGFNVAIIAAVVYFPLRWLWVLIPGLRWRWPAQRAAAAGAAITALVYAAVAGFEPPVTRATVMVLLAFLASVFNRRVSFSRVLALAWITILISTPAAILSPGVWLSFSAVVGIAWVSSGRLTPPPAWQQALRIQLFLSLVLAPLSLYFFSGLSWIAPLINLPAVPLVTLLTPILVGTAALAWLCPSIGVPLLQFTADKVQTLRIGLEWFIAHIPAPWLAAAPSTVSLGLALIGAIWLFAPKGLPTRYLALALLIPLAVPHAASIRQGFVLTVLDVGQGLSAVIQTAHHSLVFDAGPAYEEGFDAGASIVAPFLLNQGISQLDTLVISHPDLDHRGGAPAIRAILHPTRELGPLGSEPCTDGQHWNWDGVEFSMIYPPPSPPPQLSDSFHSDPVPHKKSSHGAATRNNLGCVLKVASTDYAILLPGDIERSAELRLVKAHHAELAANLLISPHHGSKSSSSEEFLAAVHPHWIVIPAGFANQYHFPHPDVVHRMQTLGAQIATTGNSGAITISDTNLAPIPILYRDTRHQFWNSPNTIELDNTK